MNGFITITGLLNAALQEYCQGYPSFSAQRFRASRNPNLDREEMQWWQSLSQHEAQGGQLVELLSTGLPQLLLPQIPGISRTSLYRRLVVQGQHLRQPPPGLQPKGWERAEELRFQLVVHFCGAIPVLMTPCRNDFERLVRALGHRGEPASVDWAVNGIAVEGLTHWHVQGRVAQKAATRLIVLHEAPYGSLSAATIPGKPSRGTWLQASVIWRLEHELTHLATSYFFGKMRLNLLDELIADAMGMVRALEIFNADLFLRCMGMEQVNAGVDIKMPRWRTYVGDLNENDQRLVLQLLRERVQEIEQTFSAHPHLLRGENVIARFQWLCAQRLDTPISAPDQGASIAQHSIG
jgi:hypothetical protein